MISLVAYFVYIIRALFPALKADAPLQIVVANQQMTTAVDETIRCLVRDLKGIVLIPDATRDGKSVARWASEYDIPYVVFTCRHAERVLPLHWRVGKQHNLPVPQKSAARHLIRHADEVYIVMPPSGYDDTTRDLVDYARAKGKTVKVIRAPKGTDID